VDSDPITRCPVCGTDHRDADDDSGVWAGTRKEALPESVEAFAAEHKIEWWLTKRYGERAA
jgi:hypothetical protein